jgi:hypothetical protein
MTPTDVTNVGELWTDLIDRDLETLVAGGTPTNDDLVPLRSFVSTLSSQGNVEPPDGFVETHAGLSAATARAIHESMDSHSVESKGTVLFGIRRRAAAMATSLMMISGMTGIALAADGAAPGDWNFGISQALEAIGIGAGEAQEPLQELQALRSDDAESRGDELVASETTGVTGPERAAQVVANSDHGNERSNEVRTRVALLLEYLADTESVDRPTVAELVKAFAGNPDHAGKPETTGKPLETPTQGSIGSPRPPSPHHP